MPITKEQLPAIIKAMMENGETQKQKLRSLNGIVDVVMHLETQEKPNSNGEYEISTEPITQVNLNKILDEFDIFKSATEEQQYLIMHMLHRNCNDVIDDLKPHLKSHTLMRTALRRWGWGSLGKITNLQEIPKSHMKPLMVAVIGHLEGKGLPILKVAKTAKKELSNLIEDWNVAAENRLAEGKAQEGKAQSEGLSGFSSLSKKALMALFKASLSPDRKAQGLIAKYAAIEQNNEVIAPQPDSQKTGGGGGEIKTRTPPTSASQQPDDNSPEKSNVYFTGYNPVDLSNLHGGAFAKEKKEANQSLDKYKKSRSNNKWPFSKYFPWGTSKHIKIAAAKALQSVITKGSGTLSVEHIQALTEPGRPWGNSNLASCISGFMSPDAYKSFKKLGGKKEKSIDIAFSVVDGKIVLTEKAGAVGAKAGAVGEKAGAVGAKAGAATSPQATKAGQPAGVRVRARAAAKVTVPPQKAEKAATSPLVVAAAKATEQPQEAAKSQARPEALRKRCNPCDKRCNPCDTGRQAVYAAWTVAAGATSKAADAACAAGTATINTLLSISNLFTANSEKPTKQTEPSHIGKTI